MCLQIICSILALLISFSVSAIPYDMYVRQVPTQNLLTENAYAGFEPLFFQKRELDVKSGNSATEGMHINLVHFPASVFKSSQYKILKNTSAHKITGKTLERTYEQKLRAALKREQHNKPVHVLAHETFVNDYLKVSSYLGQAEVFNLKSHFILFLSEKPLVDIPYIVSLPINRINLSIYNSAYQEGQALESTDRRLNQLSKLPLKNLSNILLNDFAKGFEGKLPKKLLIDVEFGTAADSLGFKEYFTVEKTLNFTKTCRYLF